MATLVDVTGMKRKRLSSVARHRLHFSTGSRSPEPTRRKLCLQPHLANSMSGRRLRTGGSRLLTSSAASLWLQFEIFKLTQGSQKRISIGYFLASISEIWLVNSTTVDSPLAFVRKYYIQWMSAALLCVLYMCMVYGLFVPDWEYEVLNGNFSVYKSSTQIVNCKVRGSLEPPCNAVGLIDRYLLGQNHLYQRPVYRRTKECSVSSPDYGPLPPNSPGWCLTPFDPEGVLSSLMAAVTCFMGLHFGHILVHVQVDVKDFRRPLLFLQWMGMNALIIFALAACELALAACELFPAALRGFYWRSPENNLVHIPSFL
ncbi:hypothetical protein CDL15_Pgr010060 [Punica granatum]|uniref:Heparan-alpha-glucosaminide N-acetyltransferase catalytic domain-containing protein n=1 Tax=Punica granatum TaxID=22663 RepID=A0A218X6T2_PUNGR|nr:hypothetical protein CDL15_Pgr010060 [Punica granatum]